MKKTVRARRKKPSHVTRQEVESLLAADPSGRKLARLLLAKGVAARVDKSDEQFEPLPAFGG
jgi:hypothetical protein